MRSPGHDGARRRHRRGTPTQDDGLSVPVRGGGCAVVGAGALPRLQGGVPGHEQPRHDREGADVERPPEDDLRDREQLDLRPEVERHHDDEPHDVQPDEDPREPGADPDHPAVAPPPERVLLGARVPRPDEEADDRPPDEHGDDGADEEAGAREDAGEEGVLRLPGAQREERGDRGRDERPEHVLERGALDHPQHREDEGDADRRDGGGAHVVAGGRPGTDEHDGRQGRLDRAAPPAEGGREAVADQRLDGLGRGRLRCALVRRHCFGRIS